MTSRNLVIVFRSLMVYLLTMVFVSCEKVEDPIDLTVNNLKGYFVVSEGDFYKNNGDITFFNPENLELHTNLYAATNQNDCGDIVQSFAIKDSLGFIVANNSGKIEIVSMVDFKSVKSIKNLSYPRCIVSNNNNELFVSNGNGFGSDCIYVINRATLSITDTIAVGKGPEKLLISGNYLYVANSGAWSTDKTVSVINMQTKEVAKTITVGSVPIDMVKDKNGTIWVYCKGDVQTDWSFKNSMLYKINPSNFSTSTIALNAITTFGINNLAIDISGDNLYVITNAVYKMPITATIFPTEKFIDNTFYGMDVDPANDNVIVLDGYGAEANVFSSAGVKLYTFKTAANPNAVVFSN